MTDYGIEIRNKSNIIIIDSTYKNHIYHSHGTASVSPYLNEIDIDDISTTGLLFIMPPSGIYARPYGFVKNGSVYDKIIIAASASGTVDWIVYQECDTTASGYGLNIYNASGEIVFSSNERGYVNVVNAVSYGGDMRTGENISVVSTSNYFEVTGGYIGGSSSGGVERRYMVGIKKVDTNTIELKRFIYYTAPTEWNGGWESVRSPNKLIEIKPPIGV